MRRNNKYIYVNHISISNRVNWAQRITIRSANVKDWRLNKRGRAMKEIAKDIMEGRGYIIATVQELVDRFGRNAFVVVPTDTGKRYIWGVYTSVPNNNGRVTLDFVSA